MTQHELKNAIAETLHRNLEILIGEASGSMDVQDDAGRIVRRQAVTSVDVRAMLDACAANLAQTIPEMFATVVLNETVAAAVRRVREQEREACAAKLDAMADEISEDSASRAQQLRAAAEAVRKQGA